MLLYPHLKVGDERIPRKDKVRSIGLLLDANMTMVPQVSNCVRSSVYHLRNIKRIRQHLNSKAAQQVVHAFVTSRIDMYNSTLFGLPNVQIQRIQKVLNAAARMITRQRLSDHITPTLQQIQVLAPCKAADCVQNTNIDFQGTVR